MAKTTETALRISWLLLLNLAVYVSAASVYSYDSKFGSQPVSPDANLAGAASTEGSNGLRSLDLFQEDARTEGGSLGSGSEVVSSGTRAVRSHASPESTSIFSNSDSGPSGISFNPVQSTFQYGVSSQDVGYGSSVVDVASKPYSSSGLASTTNYSSPISDNGWLTDPKVAESSNLFAVSYASTQPQSNSGVVSNAFALSYKPAQSSSVSVTSLQPATAQQSTSQPAQSLYSRLMSSYKPAKPVESFMTNQLAATQISSSAGQSSSQTVGGPHPVSQLILPSGGHGTLPVVPASQPQVLTSATSGTSSQVAQSPYQTVRKPLQVSPLPQPSGGHGTLPAADASRTIQGMSYQQPASQSQVSVATTSGSSSQVGQSLYQTVGRPFTAADASYRIQGMGYQQPASQPQVSAATISGTSSQVGQSSYQTVSRPLQGVQVLQPSGGHSTLPAADASRSIQGMGYQQPASQSQVSVATTSGPSSQVGQSPYQTVGRPLPAADASYRIPGMGYQWPASRPQVSTSATSGTSPQVGQSPFQIVSRPLQVSPRPQPSGGSGTLPAAVAFQTFQGMGYQQPASQPQVSGATISGTSSQVGQGSYQTVGRPLSAADASYRIPGLGYQWPASWPQVSTSATSGTSPQVGQSPFQIVSRPLQVSPRPQPSGSSGTLPAAVAFQTFQGMGYQQPASQPQVSGATISGTSSQVGQGSYQTVGRPLSAADASYHIPGLGYQQSASQPQVSTLAILGPSAQVGQSLYQTVGRPLQVGQVLQPSGGHSTLPAADASRSIQGMSYQQPASWPQVSTSATSGTGPQVGQSLYQTVRKPLQVSQLPQPSSVYSTLPAADASRSIQGMGYQQSASQPQVSATTTSGPSSQVGQSLYQTVGRPLQVGQSLYQTVGRPLPAADASYIIQGMGYQQPASQPQGSAVTTSGPSSQVGQSPYQTVSRPLPAAGASYRIPDRGYQQSASQPQLSTLAIFGPSAQVGQGSPQTLSRTLQVSPRPQPSGGSSTLPAADASHTIQGISHQQSASQPQVSAVTTSGPSSQVGQSPYQTVSKPLPAAGASYRIPGMGYQQSASQPQVPATTTSGPSSQVGQSSSQIASKPLQVGLLLQPSAGHGTLPAAVASQTIQGMSYQQPASQPQVSSATSLPSSQAGLSSQTLTPLSSIPVAPNLGQSSYTTHTYMPAMQIKPEGSLYMMPVQSEYHPLYRRYMDSWSQPTNGQTLPFDHELVFTVRPVQSSFPGLQQKEAFFQLPSGYSTQSGQAIPNIQLTRPAEVTNPGYAPGSSLVSNNALYQQGYKPVSISAPSGDATQNSGFAQSSQQPSQSSSLPVQQDSRSIFSTPLQPVQETSGPALNPYQFTRSYQYLFSDQKSSPVRTVGSSVH